MRNQNPDQVCSRIDNLSFVSDKRTLELIFKSSFSLGYHKNKVEEINIHADKNGLTSRFMDCSHVALIDFRFNNLEDYNLKSEIEFNFSVNSDQIMPILKTLDKNAKYEININNAMNQEELKFIINEIDHEWINDNYTQIKKSSQTIIIQKAENYNCPLPKIQDESNREWLSFLVEDLNNILTSFKQYDYLTIEKLNDKIIFKSVSDQGTQIRIINDIQKDNAQNKKSNVSFEILADWIKSIKGNIDRIYLSLGNHKPILISTSYQNDQNFPTEINYYLAPRVED